MQRRNLCAFCPQCNTKGKKSSSSLLKMHREHRKTIPIQKFVFQTDTEKNLVKVQTKCLVKSNDTRYIDRKTSIQQICLA